SELCSAIKNLSALLPIRLGVIPREVVNALGGRCACDAGVGSVVIIVVQPVSICRGSGFVAVIGLRIRPFLGQGAVEAFDFAIGLGPIGFGEAVFDVCA